MSSTPKDATAPAILTHFQSVEDPRQEGSALVPSGSTSFLPPFHSEVQHQHVVARVVRSAASCAAVKKRR